MEKTSTVEMKSLLIPIDTFFTSVIGTPLYYSKNFWFKMPAVKRLHCIKIYNGALYDGYQMLNDI